MIIPVLIINSEIPFEQERKMSVDEAAYYAICALVEDAWHKHTEMVDSWIAVGNYEAMRESQEACEQLEARQHKAYKQLWCRHENLKDGESICPDCDKWFDQSVL